MEGVFNRVGRGSYTPFSEKLAPPEVGCLPRYVPEGTHCKVRLSKLTKPLRSSCFNLKRRVNPKDKNIALMVIYGQV